MSNLLYLWSEICVCPSCVQGRMTDEMPHFDEASLQTDYFGVRTCWHLELFQRYYITMEAGEAIGLRLWERPRWPASCQTNQQLRCDHMTWWQPIRGCVSVSALISQLDLPHSAHVGARAGQNYSVSDSNSNQFFKQLIINSFHHLTYTEEPKQLYDG